MIFLINSRKKLQLAWYIFNFYFILFKPTFKYQINKQQTKKKKKKEGLFHYTKLESNTL